METYAELLDTGVLMETTGKDHYIASLNNGTAVRTVNGCWILASVQAQEDQSGANIDNEIQAAQDTVEFNMGG